MTQAKHPCNSPISTGRPSRRSARTLRWFPRRGAGQHGHHLPLLPAACCWRNYPAHFRASRRARSDRTIAVVGQLDHHLDFPGTLAPGVSRRARRPVGEFIQHGFVVSCSSMAMAATTPGRQAVFEIRQRHRTEHLLLLFATYWRLAQTMESEPRPPQRQMAHACEWETSVILRLAPKLVGGLDQLGPFPPARRSSRPRAAGSQKREPSRATSEIPPRLRPRKGQLYLACSAMTSLPFWSGSLRGTGRVGTDDWFRSIARSVVEVVGLRSAVVCVRDQLHGPPDAGQRRRPHHDAISPQPGTIRQPGMGLRLGLRRRLGVVGVLAIVNRPLGLSGRAGLMVWGGFATGLVQSYEGCWSAGRCWASLRRALAVCD